MPEGPALSGIFFARDVRGKRRSFHSGMLAPPAKTRHDRPGTEAFCLTIGLNRSPTGHEQSAIGTNRATIAVHRFRTDGYRYAISENDQPSTRNREKAQRFWVSFPSSSCIPRGAF
jgi:hypothetical protein